MGHVADDGLSAFVHRDVLHRNLLLAVTAVAFKCLDLDGKSSGQFIQRALRAVPLHDVACVSEAAGKIDGQN